ncbi:hypothetical protein [Micromonospora psammae]|uniref:hypothetical protein n=1 Tax=Micromonospora sp. CPCC 205556 TaxID=3122398 RepID=UPI002FEF6FF6
MIKVRPWAERSNTIAIIPGKKSERRESLVDIASQLPRPAGEEILVRRAAGPPVSVSVDDICVNQLSRGALVRRESDNRWVAAEPLLKWLANPLDDALAEHLHGNTKFFGELLANIEKPNSKADFLALARKYGLHWTSTTQLYARINFMELLGLVEQWETYKFVITDRGRSLVARIQLVDAAAAVGEELRIKDAKIDFSLPAPREEIADLLAGLDDQHLRNRKVIIGYIPRGRKAPDRESDAGSVTPLEAIRALVDLIGDRCTVEDFFDRCSQQLGMKKSSITQTLQTLRQMGVIESVAFNEYAPTVGTLDLIQPGQELDFVRYLHSRYRFFGELLTLISDPTPVPDVVKVAKEVHELAQIDNSEIRTRLGFMIEAGLVDRIDWTRYRASIRGRALIESLPLEEPDDPQSGQDGGVEAASGPYVADELARLTADLRNYSHRSDASREFEIAVARAFEFLGFAAQHLGGSGRTDVVLETHLPDKDAYRAIIDAKASASGTITDNHVKFDALKDHQRIHRADFGMIVGPDFAERVRVWAANNGFTLLTVEDLIAILKRHLSSPITLTELKGLFQQTGDNLTDIEEQYSSAERSSALLAKLVELLHAEARDEDPLMDGYISVENINYALRKDMNPRPPTSAVEEALQFLSHDFVRGAIKDGPRYKLADAPVNIRRRLIGLGNSLELPSEK